VAVGGLVQGEPLQALGDGLLRVLVAAEVFQQLLAHLAGAPEVAAGLEALVRRVEERRPGAFRGGAALRRRLRARGYEQGEQTRQGQQSSPSHGFSLPKK